MSTAVAQLPFSARAIDAVERTGELEGLMPKQYRSMAKRFIQTARLYISTCNHRDKLQQCTLGSVVTAILAAAKFGLLVDGKQGHLVPFSTKVKKLKDGKTVEEWENQAQFIPDYKGIVNAARRTGMIVDAFAEHHHENDLFKRRMVNGVWSVEYEPCLGDRGDYLGTFAVILLPDNRFQVCYMTADEIDHVMKKSKAKDFGPWKDDKPEMAKKTAIKRGLKMYSDDPELLSLVEYDNELIGTETIDTTAVESVKVGVRKAPPLAIAHQEETVSFSEMIEGEPDGEAVPVKVEKPRSKPAEKPQEAIQGVNEYINIFAACASRKVLHECRADLMASDPSLEILDRKAHV